MSPPRVGNTRQLILDRARDLLQTRGVEGFSYRDIATTLGVKNAAIHYHFPTKNDLTMALVEEFAAEIRSDIRTAREAGIPPRPQLEAYFQRSVREVEEGWRICAFGALSATYERLPEDMQQAVVRLRMMIHEWLTETLEAGRAQGVFQFAGDAACKAVQIAAAVQGARQLSKMVGKNVVGHVIGQFRTELYPDAAGGSCCESRLNS